MKEVMDLPLVVECNSPSHLRDPFPSPWGKSHLDPPLLNLNDVPREEEGLILEVLFPHPLEQRIVLSIGSKDDEPPSKPDVGDVPKPLFRSPHSGGSIVRYPIRLNELPIDPPKLIITPLIGCN